jgi:hypothetical protein
MVKPAEARCLVPRDQQPEFYAVKTCSSARASTRRVLVSCGRVAYVDAVWAGVLRTLGTVSGMESQRSATGKFKTLAHSGTCSS